MSAIGTPFGAGATYSLSVSNSTASVQVNLNATAQQQVRVVSIATNPTVFIKFGGASVTAATSDMPILPGTVEVFTIGVAATYIAAITSSASGTLYITAGYGE